MSGFQHAHIHTNMNMLVDLKYDYERQRNPCNIGKNCFEADTQGWPILKLKLCLLCAKV